MNRRPFLPINTNIVPSPVSPVGLEYIGETLISAKVTYWDITSC